MSAHRAAFQSFSMNIDKKANVMKSPGGEENISDCLLQLGSSEMVVIKVDKNFRKTIKLRDELFEIETVSEVPGFA